MTIGAIVFCRLDSRRLPGKTLTVVRGRPLLDYALARLDLVEELNGRVVVATSTRPVDDPIADYCGQRRVSVFRGDAEDVVGRALRCARHQGWSAFLRVNSDSPFLDPELVRCGLHRASAGNYDLITNLHPRSFPYGISFELLDTDVFEQVALREPKGNPEFITQAYYANIGDFRYLNLACPEGDLSHLRLTVDTPEDLERFQRVVHQFGDQFDQARYPEVLSYLGNAGVAA